MERHSKTVSQTKKGTQNGTGRIITWKTHFAGVGVLPAACSNQGKHTINVPKTNNWMLENQKEIHKARRVEYQQYSLLALLGGVATVTCVF